MLLVHHEWIDVTKILESVNFFVTLLDSDLNFGDLCLLTTCHSSSTLFDKLLHQTSLGLLSLESLFLKFHSVNLVKAFLLLVRFNLLFSSKYHFFVAFLLEIYQFKLLRQSFFHLSKYVQWIFCGQVSIFIDIFMVLKYDLLTFFIQQFTDHVEVALGTSTWTLSLGFLVLVTRFVVIWHLLARS